MSHDKRIFTSALILTANEWYVPGFLSGEVSGIWTYTSPAPNGGTVLTSNLFIDDMNAELLQGGLLFENPESFSGLDSEGNIVLGSYGTTTTMPNSNAPIIDTLWCKVYAGIWKVRCITVNENGYAMAIVEDPGGTAINVDGYTMYGLNSLFNAPRNVIMGAQSGVTASVTCLDGTSITDLALPHEISSDGDIIDPFMVQMFGADGNAVVLK